MNKYLSFLQPSNPNILTLLVDIMNKSENFAVTNDNEKCEYNKHILDKYDTEIDSTMQIKTALSQRGVSVVLPLGRYICLIESSVGGENQRMLFFDFTKTTDFRELNNTILDNHFSDTIVSKLEELSNRIKNTYTEDKNFVHLYLSLD